MSERQNGEPLSVTEADVVVIGAGAFGVTAAYQLASLGAGRVVLLDQFAPASQTSPRAAGLFKLIQADETLTRLARLSIEIVTGFESDTGVSLPVVASGSLLTARTAAHGAMIRDEAAASQGWGVDCDLIDPAARERVAPYLAGTALHTTLHIPGDIFIEEPATMLAAYIEAGRRRGVTVRGDTPVTGLKIRGGRIAGVVTPRGEIQTETVVDAAGAWTAMVAALGKVAVPIVPVRHQLLITEPMLGLAPDAPITRITDAAVYVRPARGGMMVGGFESDPMPLDPQQAGHGFAMDRVPLDMAVLDRFTADAQAEVPALPGAAVAEHRGGLFTMTADARFLLGPAPGLGGFWLATGCNGSGFSLSSGCGRVLAEWITAGTPPFDIGTLDPRRFGETAFEPEALTKAGIWQYTNYYTPAAVSA